MKKIAIIGTHGVGKTTLCKKLRSTLEVMGKNVELIEEIVRECPFSLHEEMIYETAEWIALNQILREREAQLRNPEYLICDRSAFDPLPYLGAFFSPKKPYRQEMHHALYLFLSEYLRTYYKIVCIAPTGEPIEDDGFRNTNLDIQEKVHLIFHEELCNLDFECKWDLPNEGPCVLGFDSREIFCDTEKVINKILELEE